MTLPVDYCQQMIAEHARMNPLADQPETTAFIALAGIQAALFEQGIAVDIHVRTVHLKGGNMSRTNCAALMVEGEVLGLHGARGWDDVGRVGAKIQFTYGVCGRFGRVGDLAEVWHPGCGLQMNDEDGALFEAWRLHCRAVLGGMLMTSGTPPVTSPVPPIAARRM